MLKKTLYFLVGIFWGGLGFRLLLIPEQTAAQTRSFFSRPISLWLFTLISLGVLILFYRSVQAPRHRSGYVRRPDTGESPAGQTPGQNQKTIP